MEGWIKLHRGLLESNVWTCEPFSRGQAWVDLLLLANHKDTFFYKRGHKIDVKRGQLGRSAVELSDRWKWSRSKVNKFLKDLEKEQQIKQQKNNVTQVITIINYGEYQQKEQQTEQQKSSRSAAEVQQKDTYKNDKNDKNDKNEKKYSIEDIEFFNKVFDEKFKMQINSFLAKEFPNWVHDEFRFGQPHIDRFQNKWKRSLPKYWTFFTVSQAREQYLKFIKENFLKPEVAL